MTNYKTVALDRLCVKDGTSANEAVAPVAKAIEREAEGGWEFVNMYQMPVDIKLGCIQSILNRSSNGGTAYIYMLVFKKEN